MCKPQHSTHSRAGFRHSYSISFKQYWFSTGLERSAVHARYSRWPCCRHNISSHWANAFQWYTGQSWITTSPRSVRPQTTRSPFGWSLSVSGCCVNHSVTQSEECLARCICNIYYSQLSLQERQDAMKISIIVSTACSSVIGCSWSLWHTPDKDAYWLEGVFCCGSQCVEQFATVATCCYIYSNIQASFKDVPFLLTFFSIFVYYS